MSQNDSLFTNPPTPQALYRSIPETLVILVCLDKHQQAG